MKRLFLIIIGIFFPLVVPVKAFILLEKWCHLQRCHNGSSVEEAANRPLGSFKKHLLDCKVQSQAIWFSQPFWGSLSKRKRRRTISSPFMGCSALGEHLSARGAAPLSIPQAQTIKLWCVTASRQGRLEWCTLLSHLHFSLERKQRSKLKFRLLKLGQDFPWQVHLQLPCSVQGSLCLSPCPSLPLTLHQPLLSHQMWFRDIWTRSENALKCRKNTFNLGSGISSAECNSFPGDANTSTAKHFLNQTSY